MTGKGSPRLCSCSYAAYQRQVDLNLSLASKLTLLVSSDRQGNNLGMVQDIADCLVWARESGPKLNFDKVQKCKPL